MNSINFKWRQGLLYLGTLALSLIAVIAFQHFAIADSTDLTLTASSNAVIQQDNSNSTVVSEFTPALDLTSNSATVTANASSSSTVYYGVTTNVSTTTNPGHWQIRVSHNSESLTTGDVAISERGFYDATGNGLEDAGYNVETSAGDLIFALNGNSGYPEGDTFTVVNGITFGMDAPTGQYTFTQSYVDANSSDAIGTPFSFTVNLTGDEDNSTSTATSTPSSTSTSTPVVTLLGDETLLTSTCFGFTDPGATTTTSSTATTTTRVVTSGNVDIEHEGTYFLTYSATDPSSGNIGRATRTVVVRNCGSGGGSHSGSSGGGSSSGGSSSNLTNNSGSSVIAGQILGTAGFLPAIPATGGEVLGASTFQFLTNLRTGMRGTDVMELQTRLTTTGYFSGPVTGYFGPMTMAAVKRFQTANGLPSTGYVGPMTRALLNS